LVAIKKKAERRDRVREAKALIAANIEQRIEEELMERLKTGVYRDIYNYHPRAFEKLVRRQKRTETEEAEEAEEGESQREYVAMESEEEQQEQLH
jgi:protein MAK16